MWSKLVSFLAATVPAFLKKYASAFILRALGLAGGIWGWIVSGILIVVWDRIQAWLESTARKQDQKTVDDANQAKYEKDKLEGAPVEVLIKDETDILNGNKPK